MKMELSPSLAIDALDISELQYHCGPTSLMHTGPWKNCVVATYVLLPDGTSPHCSANSQDEGVFYRKQLTLQHPSSACEVKVISRSPCLPVCVFALFPFPH